MSLKYLDSCPGKSIKFFSSYHYFKSPISCNARDCVQINNLPSVGIRAGMLIYNYVIDFTVWAATNFFMSTLFFGNHVLFEPFSRSRVNA